MIPDSSIPDAAGLRQGSQKIIFGLELAAHIT